MATASSSPSYGITTRDWKSTRLNSSHVRTAYAVFCLKRKAWDGEVGLQCHSACQWKSAHCRWKFNPKLQWNDCQSGVLVSSEPDLLRFLLSNDRPLDTPSHSSHERPLLD